MPESVVPCPACGAAAAVPPAGAAPCPGCGLLVSARPRVRAERDDTDAARPRPPWALITLIVLVAGGVAVYAYLQRREAEEFERRARLEAERAEEQRRWEREQATRRRAEIAALAVALPEMIAAGGGPPADAAKASDELGTKAVGVWRGTGHAGGTREVEYRADGTFRDRVTGAGAREWAGTWAVAGATGSRLLRLTRTGGGPAAVRLAFEGDELIHDDEPGRATVLRKN